MTSESVSFAGSFQRRTEGPVRAVLAAGRFAECSPRAGALPVSLRMGVPGQPYPAASAPLSNSRKRIEKPHPPMMREDGGISREQY